ncbi:hypothetical protein ACG7TL_002174 [Trametes sanguinea]
MLNATGTRASQTSARLKGIDPVEERVKKMTYAELSAHCKERIPDYKAAVKHLEKEKMIPKGETEPTMEVLISGLMHFSALVPEKERAAMGLAAFAVYAKAAVDREVSKQTVSVTMEVVEDRMAGMLERMESSAKAAEQTVEDLREARQALRDSAKKLEADAEIARSVQLAGQGSSYAAVAAGRGITPPSSVARAVEKARLRARQVLVDNLHLRGADGEQIKEEVIVAKANEALRMAREDGETPEGAKAVAATVLRNGGVVIEFNSEDAALWARSPHLGAEVFSRNMGAEVLVKTRLHKVVVEFVPVRFNPDSQQDIAALEVENGLSRGSVMQARWLKAIARRHAHQVVAHLLLAFDAADEANLAIRNGLTILGKRVQARKCLIEPMRCAKCHKYEPPHLAKECKEVKERCATCASTAHLTRECAEADPAAFWCLNCDSGTHATWDRGCPVFQRKLQSMQARQADYGMRFFPTEAPHTWEVLRVWQQNLNKSADATADLLHSASPENYDLLAIQEPYIDFLGLTRATHHWYVVYPSGHHDTVERSRSVILVSKKLSTNSWSPVNLPSPDVTAISIITGDSTVHLFNLYVDGSHDRAIHASNRAVARLRTGPSDHLIWLGDFNRHHPLWDEARNHHLFTPASLERAQVLLDKVVALGMEMVLPAGTPTLEASRSKNLTRPDNVFCSEGLVESLVRCEVVPHLRPPKTDHFPVLTTFGLNMELARSVARRNFRAVDWAAFNKTLSEALAAAPLPVAIISKMDLDRALARLNSALDAAVKKDVPLTSLCPFSKRWWSKDLERMRRESKRLGREAHRMRGDPSSEVHKTFRAARNRYTDHIRAAKRDHWNAWLDSVDSRSIWAAHRFVKNGSTDGGSCRIPPIRAEQDGRPVTLTSNEQKGEEFYQTFFLPPGAAPTLGEDFEYPPEAFGFRAITDRQVEEAIRQLRAFKVPGPDGIPNEVYKHCAAILTPLLGKIFRATFDLKYYPACWKVSDTIVLRKPGKPDYTVAKAYRPVALLNCMSKILSRCVANVLVYEMETRGLLPDLQFGGRPGRTTTDSIHYVTKTIKDAWRTGRVASVLFLDIKSAFPSATPEVLFHDMRMQGIPQRIVAWLRAKLSGRSTCLKFDDYESDPFQILSGIDQGCPLSVILYAIYNAALLKSADRKNGETAVGSMDDVALVVTGKTFEEAHAKAQAFMRRDGGAQDWSTSHNSAFSVEKFGLINCARVRPGLGPQLTLEETVISPSEQQRFLGVLLDRRLRFHQQTASALAKGTAWVALIRRLARMQHGLAMAEVRRLYLAVAVPSMLYAADTFLVPVRPRGESRHDYGSVGAIRKLARVQRQALLVMTGAMRSTATDVMEAHADLLPFPLLIDKLCQRATVRLCTLPTSHPLHPHVLRASRRYVKSHRAPLHELLYTYRESARPEEMEKVQPTRRHPRAKLPHSTAVAASKEAAIEDDKQWAEDGGIRVYSDGSDVDGGVGAAAVLYREGRRGCKVLRYHLGSSADQSSYGAEVVGEILGAALIARERRDVQLASIALDSTSAITSTTSRTPRAGHYLTDWFIAEARRAKLKHEGMDLTVRWVAGHRGAEGNERADTEAKAAARGDSSEAHLLPACLRRALPRSAAKARQVFLKQIKGKAATQWRQSARGIKLKAICGTLPSKKYTKLIASLGRRQACLLIQLRSGHAPLAAHLHRIGKVDSADCPMCGEARETVLHYLLQCPGFAAARHRHLAPLGMGGVQLSKLLNSDDTMEPLFSFINATGRFRTVFGTVAMAEGGRRTTRCAQVGAGQRRGRGPSGATRARA